VIQPRGNCSKVCNIRFVRSRRRVLNWLAAKLLSSALDNLGRCFTDVVLCDIITRLSSQDTGLHITILIKERCITPTITEVLAHHSQLLYLCINCVQLSPCLLSNAPYAPLIANLVRALLCTHVNCNAAVAHASKDFLRTSSCRMPRLPIRTRTISHVTHCRKLDEHGDLQNPFSASGNLRISIVLAVCVIAQGPRTVVTYSFDQTCYL
jgi:hypothetical protein